MPALPRFDDVRSAALRIANAIHRTPCPVQRHFSSELGRPVYLKWEHLQKTGSFKPRGILNHLRSLPPEALQSGVITISAGNAAQAVAWAAREAGTGATVVMPEYASSLKAEASRGYGAEVILHGTTAEAFQRVRELAEERGLKFVHPFDHPDIIAGHGTCAMEIVEDVPEVEDIVVPCGGGGLVAGIALATTALRPEARVWCVEPEGADAMHRSFGKGEPVHLDGTDTIADGLAAPMAGDFTYAVLREHAQGCLRVSDDEIRSAMRMLFDRTKQAVEPAGAAGLAALLEGRVGGDGPVVVILSGGNVDRALYADILRGVS